MSASVGDLALAGLLGFPTLGVLLLAAISRYRIAAPLNVVLCGLTLVAAALLYTHRPEPTLYLLVDDFNTVFLIVGALVGFTTSWFSAGYIAHELQGRRLKRRDLRFYHAMYQLLMLAMNVALVSNNIGLMWVAVEVATLTTVMMVGIYRTNAALEAAWKYFILGSVGIALALFGTILVYLAAQEPLGQGTAAMAWDRLVAGAAGFDPALLNLAFVFLLLGYGTKVGLAPMHAWLPDAHAEGPTPISAVLSGLLLNVALFALLRFKLIMAGNPAVISPGPMMVALGPLVADFRELHAVPPARHQTHVRVLLDRAHGDHHARVRARRSAREFRRGSCTWRCTASRSRASFSASATFPSSRARSASRTFAG